MSASSLLAAALAHAAGAARAGFSLRPARSFAIAAAVAAAALAAAARAGRRGASLPFAAGPRGASAGRARAGAASAGSGAPPAHACAAGAAGCWSTSLSAAPRTRPRPDLARLISVFSAAVATAARRGFTVLCAASTASAKCAGSAASSDASISIASRMSGSIAANAACSQQNLLQCGHRLLVPCSCGSHTTSMGSCSPRPDAAELCRWRGSRLQAC